MSKRTSTAGTKPAKSPSESLQTLWRNLAEIETSLACLAAYRIERHAGAPSEVDHSATCRRSRRAARGSGTPPQSGCTPAERSKWLHGVIVDVNLADVLARRLGAPDPVYARLDPSSNIRGAWEIEERIRTYLAELEAAASFVGRITTAEAIGAGRGRARR